MLNRLIIPTAMLLIVIAGCHDDELPTGPSGQDTIEIPTDTTDTTDTSGTAKFCFQNDVLPLLIANCASSGCHDNITQEERIDVTSYAAVMASRRGDFVRPGQPDESEMYKVLFASGNDAMPPQPRPRLPSEQVAAIRRWIAEGAKDEDCGSTPACDTADVTFVADIQPIITQRCSGCHSSAVKSGGIDLSTRALVEASARSGKLLGSMSRQSGYVPMPPSGPKASDCEIAKVRLWISAGYR